MGMNYGFNMPYANSKYNCNIQLVINKKNPCLLKSTFKSNITSMKYKLYLSTARAMNRHSFLVVAVMETSMTWSFSGRGIIQTFSLQPPRSLAFLTSSITAQSHSREDMDSSGCTTPPSPTEEWSGRERLPTPYSDQGLGNRKGAVSSAPLHLQDCSRGSSRAKPPASSPDWAVPI